MGINLLHYGITLLLTYVAGPFITMVTLFGALTIGQLSSKHKGLMGILAYAGLTILSSIIGSTVQSAFMFGASQILFLVIVIKCVKGGEKASAQPWDGAEGLSGQCPLRPPYHTFATPPEVK